MSIIAAINSTGTARNIGLKNDWLVLELTKSFIDSLEFMQSDLLGKMNDDRKQTDLLKERLKFQQNLARSIKDPESDTRSYVQIVNFGESSAPPFPGMTKLDWAQPYLPDAILPPTGMTYGELNRAKATIWEVPANADKLTGKQVYAYLDQQVEYTKSAITAVNSVTSQDNLTLQSLRSKIESVTQLLSTLMKNSYDVGATVVRNFPG